MLPSLISYALTKLMKALKKDGTIVRHVLCKIKVVVLHVE